MSWRHHRRGMLAYFDRSIAQMLNDLLHRFRCRAMIRSIAVTTSSTTGILTARMSALQAVIRPLDVAFGMPPRSALQQGSDHVGRCQSEERENGHRQADPKSGSRIG